MSSRFVFTRLVKGRVRTYGLNKGAGYVETLKHENIKFRGLSVSLRGCPVIKAWQKLLNESLSSKSHINSAFIL